MNIVFIPYSQMCLNGGVVYSGVQEIKKKKPTEPRQKKKNQLRTHDETQRDGHKSIIAHGPVLYDPHVH